MRSSARDMLLENACFLVNFLLILGSHVKAASQEDAIYFVSGLEVENPTQEDYDSEFEPIEEEEEWSIIDYDPDSSPDPSPLSTTALPSESSETTSSPDNTNTTSTSTTTTTTATTTTPPTTTATTTTATTTTATTTTPPTTTATTTTITTSKTNTTKPPETTTSHFNIFGVTGPHDQQTSEVPLHLNLPLTLIPELNAATDPKYFKVHLPLIQPAVMPTTKLPRLESTMLETIMDVDSSDWLAAPTISTGLSGLQIPSIPKTLFVTDYTESDSTEAAPVSNASPVKSGSSFLPSPVIPGPIGDFHSLLSFLPDEVKTIVRGVEGDN